MLGDAGFQLIDDNIENTQLVYLDVSTNLIRRLSYKCFKKLKAINISTNPLDYDADQFITHTSSGSIVEIEACNTVTTEGNVDAFFAMVDALKPELRFVFENLGCVKKIRQKISALKANHPERFISLDDRKFLYGTYKVPDP